MSNIILVLGGLFLVALVAVDIFLSIIVPRVTPRHLRIAPFLVGVVLWPLYKRIVLALPSKWHSHLFGLFGPVAYIVLMVAWLALMVTGFAIAIYGLRNYVRPPIANFEEALYFACTSFLTVGFGDIVAFHSMSRVVVIAAATMGLIFMALEISFLFTLQSYLQQREQTVNMLLSRAGTPASGVVLLLRYRELNIAPSMSTSFVAWEAWVATILESHRAFPLLIFFRGGADSWLSTLGALLDSSTFLSVALEEDKVGEAELFYWIGVTTVKSLATYLGLRPFDGEHVTPLEFEESLELLKAAGYKVKTAEQCYKIFLFRRSGYMRYLVPLADKLALPLPVLIRTLPIMSAASGPRASELLKAKVEHETHIISE